MLKADFGDILYYIIFAVVIIAGIMEKAAKNKRQQQQANAPRPPQPHDDFEDVEGQATSEQAPPQTIEEMMRRLLEPEPIETPVQKPVELQPLEVIPEKVQSSEYIPTFGRHYYHPEEEKIREQSTKGASSHLFTEEENDIHEYHEFEFNIRQAVIASEILNRKY